MKHQNEVASCTQGECLVSRGFGMQLSWLVWHLPRLLHLQAGALPSHFLGTSLCWYLP